MQSAFLVWVGHLPWWLTQLTILLGLHLDANGTLKVWTVVCQLLLPAYTLY
jgi:hypothetical protein